MLIVVMRPDESFTWLPYTWATPGATAGLRALTTKAPDGEQRADPQSYNTYEWTGRLDESKSSNFQRNKSRTKVKTGLFENWRKCKS